jgi:UDP-N-acetylmuramate--alanine ligase
MSMQIESLRQVHFTGIGGINMSGVAKILARVGVRVSGSDAARSEATKELEALGVPISIGHDAKHVPADCDLLIYSSAVPEKNPERLEARTRGIRELTNFEFLGHWTAGKRTVLITGTHGKSTTTSLAGLLFVAAHQDPTVIVGSRVPGFSDGNVRFGNSDLVVIEGDEYAKHFLEFRPSAVILNNIELDHTDVFPDLAAIMDAFHEMLDRVVDGGLVIANADDPNVQTLIGRARGSLDERGIRIRTFGFGSHANYQIKDHLSRTGEQVFALRDEQGKTVRFRLHVPGRMNVMNAAAAAALCASTGLLLQELVESVAEFNGIWRRFEKISDKDGVIVISDYGHHPTAVSATLEAAKSFYQGKRIVLAFQPHHRNRTKRLFDAFVPSFDRADALLLVEIYDVAGRENAEDADISSRDLQDAIVRRDSERAVTRSVEYAPNPDEALAVLKRWAREGDVVVVMGAGDIYLIANKII